MTNTEEIFVSLGGNFLSSFEAIKKTAQITKGYIFDWDGVFNDGYKHGGDGSPFSEPASMGLNMLRFSTYMRTGITPNLFILTGENNSSAVELGRRENFTAIYKRVKNKSLALKHVEEVFGVQPNELLFVFDDILDLNVADATGLRMMVNRKASPLLSSKVIREGWADYITSCQGGDHAVREICELMIALNENYDDVVEHRMAFSSQYQNYLDNRNQVAPQFFDGSSGQIRVSD